MSGLICGLELVFLNMPMPDCSPSYELFSQRDLTTAPSRAPVGALPFSLGRALWLPCPQDVVVVTQPSFQGHKQGGTLLGHFPWKQSKMSGSRGHVSGPPASVQVSASSWHLSPDLGVSEPADGSSPQPLSLPAEASQTTEHRQARSLGYL